MIWNYFDSIKCINLKTRDDRYNASKQIFDKHNIPVEYHRVDKHPNGGLQGCFESHIQIITDSYNKGDNNVIIFEDDIIDTKAMTEKNIRKIIRFLKKTDWDLFYLGAHPEIRRFTTSKTRFKSVYKIHSICGHAYIVNRQYMKKIANMNYTETPLDYIYKFNEKSYGHIPSLFIQDSYSSDISGDLFNKFPLLKIGSIKFVEFYSIYINIKLPYFLTFLLVFITLTFRFTNNIYVLLCTTILFICTLILFLMCK